jgi:hypothetical protein
MLGRPPWVQFGDADRRTLRFRWDDARAHNDFEGDPSDIADAAADISVRARLALLVGLCEWVVWRFEGLHTREEPVQILEAAWCGTVDPRYLAFFELQREEWVGPVEGPLWCAFAFLEKGFRQAHAFQADTFLAIEYVYLLAMHVLPDRAPFERWLEATLARLATWFPYREEDPFEDMFEERVGEHLGPLVGRDALNPAIAIDSARDRAFLLAVLEEARATGNPFLATEDDLEDLRFEGVPYTLPEV